MGSTRWGDRHPSYGGRKWICMRALPEKAAGHSPLLSSSTLLCVAFRNCVGSCLFLLKHLQEFSISLFQLSKAFKALLDQVVAENMSPGARLSGFKSQLYHWLLV